MDCVTHHCITALNWLDLVRNRSYDLASTLCHFANKMTISIYIWSLLQTTLMYFKVHFEGGHTHTHQCCGSVQLLNKTKDLETLRTVLQHYHISDLRDIQYITISGTKPKIFFRNRCKRHTEDKDQIINCYLKRWVKSLRKNGSKCIFF